MNVIVGVVLGLTAQIISLTVFDASQAEGFITYWIGFVVGMMLVNNSKGVSE
jgi:hypothetical protein